MIYQIVPPSLAIFSIIGVIILLVKKAPEINRLERKERMGKERESRAMVGGGNNFSRKKINELCVAAKLEQNSSVFLEQSIKKFQAIFLRIGNRMKNLRKGARKKRNSRVDEITNDRNVQLENGKIQKVKFATKENEALDGIVDRIGKHNSKKISIREKLGLRQKAKQEVIEEKYFRPIISDHIVVPKRRRETKNRLEELLIERIAANSKDIEAYERLGEYYLEIRNLEYSKECFKQVLRLNSGNSNARYKIRKLERILGS